MHLLYRLVVLPAAATLPLACAAKRPVLYPNGQFKSVSAEAAQQAIDESLRQAYAQGVNSIQTGSAAGKVATGAAASAGVGAAAGSAGGLMHAIFAGQDPDPITRSYVEKCLQGKGFDPIGWK